MKSAKVHYIHSLSYSARDKLAGTFVLIALLLVSGLFVSKVNLSRIFDPVIHYQAVMKNAQGITVETIINVSGLDVGRVYDIYLDQNNEVNIHFFVYKKFQSLIRADSVGEISRLSLVGDNIILIKAGSPDLPMLADNATIKLNEPDYLSLTDVTPAVKKFTAMLTTISSLIGSIDPAVVKTSSQDLQTLLNDLRKMSTQIADGKGSLGRILYDENHVQHIENSLALVDKTLTAIAQRVNEIQPIIANANQLALESRSILDNATQLSIESQLLIVDARKSVYKFDQQLNNLPALMQNANSVLQSADHAFNGEQPVHILIDNRIWPFSSATQSTQTELLIEDTGLDE